MLLKCFCKAIPPLISEPNTILKVALAVRVPSYAQSSHSSGGMGRASLDNEDMDYDEFQTQYTPLHCIVHQDKGSHGEQAEGMETSRRNPSWLPYYQVNISEEEEEMLQSIDPKWRVHCWLQLAVQDIANGEVPYFKLVTLLTSGVEGIALALAKCLLMLWRWSLCVQGKEACPPAPSIFNIGQFMTKDELGTHVDYTTHKD